MRSFVSTRFALPPGCVAIKDHARFPIMFQEALSFDSMSRYRRKTRNVRSLPGLQAYHPKEGERNHDNWDRPYLGPRWSPNGKVIAAEGADDGDGSVTVVDSRFGDKVFDVFQGNFSWSHDGALVIPAIGKFVFDWNSALFKRH